MGSSRNLVGNVLTEYKESLVLTPEQKDVLIGSVLGDGNIRILKKQACLTISHSEKQKEYVWWKYKIFQNWVLTKPRKEIRKYHKNQTRNLTSWRWSTISHPVLTQFYNLFYQKGFKDIPESIGSLLTSPLILAIWYMDDGSRKPHGNGAFLHTQCFSMDGQIRLMQTLKRNFSINAKLSSAGLWQGRRLFRLYITAESFNPFRNLISSYLLPSMQYKISL